MREGWTESTLGEVVDIQKGKKPPALDVFEPLSKPYLIADVLRGAPCEQFVSNGLAESCVPLSGHETILLWDGAGAGDVFKSQSGILASTMAKVQSKSKTSILDGYLYLYLVSKRVDIKSSCRGTTVPHVSPEALKSLSFSLPPLEEQKRIVDVVSSVDAYIDALQQQVNMARTARNAVLHELLSVGGDDWTETSLDEVAEVLSGYAFKSDRFSETEGIPLIRIRDLQKRNWTEVGYVGEFDSRYLVEAGDFLIGMDGEFRCYEWLGETALLNQRVCRIQDFKESAIVPRFIYFLVNNFLEEIENTTSFTTVKHISVKQVKQIVFQRPSLTEQKRIVEIIASMDDVIQSTEHAVVDAKNLRSGLLSDLLSGEHEIPSSYDKLMGDS